jgi:hypothetical protein
MISNSAIQGKSSILEYTSRVSKLKAADMKLLKSTRDGVVEQLWKIN